MKSLKEIQEEYAMDKHHVAWVNIIGFYIIQADTKNLFKSIDDTSKLFALEVAAKTLENGYRACLKGSEEGPEAALHAILDIANIPEL